MRLLHRFASRRAWLVICILALVFFIGNLVLLAPWQASDKNNHLSSHENFSQGQESRVVHGSEDQDYDENKENGHLNREQEASEGFQKESKGSEDDTTEDSDSKKHGPISTAAKTLGLQSVKATQKKKADFKYNIAVLIIACNRPTVSRCLDQILKYKPKNIDIPVIVSQDCGDKATEDVIRGYGNQLKLIKQPDLSNVADVPDNMAHFMGYYKISRHYKWAITQVFKDSNIDSVIIIEDDLDIAPDLFEYFLATRPLLDMDKSIWCISAWNDNGKEGFVKGNNLLYRTDFFPGLGWMITRELWKELQPKWPKGFWDDWMRNPKQRKGRSCIRPEISRSKTFGRVGVSMGQFFDQYLKFIKLNDEYYAFRDADLKYLLKREYDKNFVRDVYSKPVVSYEDVLSGTIQSDAVRIQYDSDIQLESMMRQFGLMTDLKAGVPRTAYKGIISFIKDGKRVYLTPFPGRKGYNET